MRILIIDDEPLFHDAFALEFDGLGYALASARNPDEARRLLDTGDFFDVVLLDQNLEGPGGTPTGLSLIPELLERSPGAAILVVSGYWDRAGVIEKALHVGASDYLVKNDALWPLLRAKLNRIERERKTQRRAFANDAQVEAHLAVAWKALLAATTSHDKGRTLEEVMNALLRLAGVFRRVEPNFANGIEEFDLVGFAEEPRWHSESQLWLIECKNWSTTVGRNEFDVLVGKMGRRHGACKRGLMVAWGGVTEPFVRGAHLLPDAVVATANRDDLAQAVASSDRATVIRGWFDRALLAP